MKAMVQRYNMWEYFYPWVRKQIFATRNNDSAYLVRTDFQQMSIEYRPDESSDIKTLSASVDSIRLHLFDNQIGLLSILSSQGETAFGLKELLTFNDLARCVSPRFLSADGASNTERAKDQGALPLKITLSGKSQSLEENFPDVIFKSSRPFERPLSTIVRGLLEPLISNSASGDLSYETNVGHWAYFYEPFHDEKMFILSVCTDKDFAESLAKYRGGHYAFETDDSWHRFVFVHSENSAIDNESMKTDLNRMHTYTRWAARGNLYGMSKNSFVIAHNGHDSFINDQATGNYYLMALIVWLQRVTLSKFSEYIGDLTCRFEWGKMRGRKRRQFQKEAEEINRRFIKFTNRYWYAELSNDIQGNELYKKWTNLLEYNRLFDQVKSEISELASHVRTIVEQDSNQRLAMIALIGLPLSIVVAVGTIWLDATGETRLTAPHGIFEWTLSVVIAVAAAISLFGFLYFASSSVLHAINALKRRLSL